MSLKTTVLVATGTMNAGGAETLIMEILRRRSDRMNYILLIHYAGNKEIGVYDKEIKSMGIPIVYIHSVGSVGEKKYIREFSEVIKKIGHVDVLHSHLNAVGGIIAKAAQKAGIKKRIVHCHADITFRGSKWKIIVNETKLSLMKCYVKKYATDRWACSNEAAVRLFGTCDGTVIIPNVIYVKDYLSNEQKRIHAKDKYNLGNRFVIGSVGRIARIKNYELIIRTISELNKRGKKVDFICFGRIADAQYFRELELLASSLHVSEQIHFVGNSTCIPLDICCIDLFFMPSHSEGFGMAAMEAQAAGIPVLVSDGVPHIVDMGLNAISFLPAENEMVWADAVEKYRPLYLDDELILKKFDEHGYNSETMVRKIEDLYIKMSNC